MTGALEGVILAGGLRQTWAACLRGERAGPFEGGLRCGGR